MSRKDRRLRRKTALRVLTGGKRADDAPRTDESTPAGRLAVKLDRFFQHEVAADPEVDDAIAMAVLLRLAAALVAEMGERAPTADVLRAFDVFIDQEREARSKLAPTEPAAPPEGA